MTGTARLGVQLASGMPSTPETGAIAATTIASSQAMRCDMKPPLEKPVTKTRLPSRQRRESASAMMARVKPMSSTMLVAAWPQQAPALKPVGEPVPSG